MDGGHLFQAINTTTTTGICIPEEASWNLNSDLHHPDIVNSYPPTIELDGGPVQVDFDSLATFLNDHRSLDDNLHDDSDEHHCVSWGRLGALDGTERISPVVANHVPSTQSQAHPSLIPPPTLKTRNRPHPQASPSTKRSKPCLGCRVDKGNRACSGSPWCERCQHKTGLQAPPASPNIIPYLDWSRWHNFCQAVQQSLPKLSEDVTIISRASGPQPQSIILELDLEDRCSRRSFQLTHVVALDLRFADGTWPRAPVITKEQFDLFIMEAMWGRLYTVRDAESFSNQEQDLFSKIKLLLGYSKLLRSFNSIWIISRAFVDDALSLFVAAELEYFLAFRVNMLFTELLGMWPAIDSDAVTGQRQAVLFYGLEAYLLWLENDLNECFKRVHDNILVQTCGLPTPQRIQVVPHLVEFARARDKDLSKHLLVSVQRHPSSIVGFVPFPLIHSRGEVRSALDLLVESRREIISGIIKGSVKPRERHPKYLVTVDNKLVEYRDLTDLGYGTHDGTKNSNSSTGGPTETAQFLIEQHPDPLQAVRPGGSTFTTVGDDFILESETGSGIGPQGPNVTVSMLSPEELARISVPIPPPGSVGFCDSWGQPISDLQLWNFRPSTSDLPETANDNDDVDENLSDTSRVSQQDEIPLKFNAVLNAMIARAYSNVLLAEQPERDHHQQN
ncbi:uncharacterized protein A1O5_11611 [Cladophialophora psammophila CBS 110553]|uniref:Uncharacterized protein n=1 Tax=Cladophialophora psammophila CBS 110553 TaxID=1182543 RepID=W9WE55_9EURO|nr:uncharacterized protein A1O5_11611 [Cladophialophora psammophila CBS 110553]EXJ63290.1 hypothetical protein A1O5_11611 [Cladophialophora psammophila CBS 110553]